MLNRLRSGIKYPLFILMVAAMAIAAMGQAPATRPAATAPAPSASFEKEIAAYEAADKVSFPPRGAVLFVGDSGFRMWKNIAGDFPGEQVINRGFGGSRMVDLVFFADRIVMPYQPRLIVVREGGNDLTTGSTPAEILAEFKTFVANVRVKLPEVRIAFCSLNPNPQRWGQAAMRKEFNAMMKAYIAGEKGLDFIDVWDLFLGPDGKPREELFLKDGLHHNADGNKIYAEAMRPHLK